MNTTTEAIEDFYGDHQESGRHEKRKCFKRRHDTEQEAEAELTRIRSISTRKKVPKRSYQCDYCGGWHLTAQDLPENSGAYDFSIKKIKKVKVKKHGSRSGMKGVYYDRTKIDEALNNGQAKVTSSKPK